MTILRSRMTIVSICLVLVFAMVASAGNESLREHNDYSSALLVPDAACGPRCLRALSHLTNIGEGNCDIETIYRFIGIPVNTPTNLKHLKDAAIKMGFKVQARKLTINDLMKLEAYAILPVGQTDGTKEDPLHFVLFAGAEGNQARLVNTLSLEVGTIPFQELGEEWKGLTLVIPSDVKGERIFKPIGGDEDKRGQIINLGEADVGSTLNKQIVVWTKNDQSKWKVALKSCSCLNVKLRRNERGHVLIDVKIDVKTAGLHGAQIVVISEDLNIRKDYQFKVYGKNSYQLSPTAGFLEVPKGRAQYAIVLDYYVGTVNDEVSFSGFKTEINHLECEEVTRELIADENLPRVRFNITLAYSVQDASNEKREDGRVFFTLTTPDGEREIPLKMTVHAGESNISITPAKLFFLVSKSHFEQKEMGVKLSSKRDNPVQKLDFEMIKPLLLKISPQKKTENEYLLCMTLIPDEIKKRPIGIYKGEIVITLNGKKTTDKIKLPVSIFIRD